MADTVNILSLYSGSGMHDEAVCAALRVLGFVPRVLGYVEREASAAAFILGRMEAAAVEHAPVYAGDLCELADGDLDDMCGRIDIIVASPPCQPYSSAGRRLGNADPRSYGDGDGPLPHTLRIIDRVRPAMVQFENVPEWVTGGHFRGFGEALCGLGYDIAPPLFLAAEDVGPPHERERVYIQCQLANAEFVRRCFEKADRRNGARAAAGRASEELDDRGLQHEQLHQRAYGPESSRGGDQLAERQSGRFGVGGKPSERDGFVDGSDTQLADAEHTEAGSIQEQEQGRTRSVDGRLCVPMFPPGRSPTDDELSKVISGAHATLRDVRGRIAGGAEDFGRWAELAAGGLDPALMPAVERGFSALADGMAISNSELLRLGGNGVVPLAAGCAFAELLGYWE